MIQGRYRGRIIALGFPLIRRRRRGNYRDLFTCITTKIHALTGIDLAPDIIVVVRKDGEGNVGLESRYHSVEPVRNTMCERKVVGKMMAGIVK